MTEEKTDTKVTTKESEVSKEKREFMKKFGRYAIAGAGMSVLLSPEASAAMSST